MRLAQKLEAFFFWFVMSGLSTSIPKDQQRRRVTAQITQEFETYTLRSTYGSVRKLDTSDPISLSSRKIWPPTSSFVLTCALGACCGVSSLGSGPCLTGLNAGGYPQILHNFSTHVCAQVSVIANITTHHAEARGDFAFFFGTV